MRNLIIIGAMVGGMFMAGWFTVNRQGDRTTIEINKNEIREDARKAISRGRDFLDRRNQEQVPADPSQWAQQPQQSYDPNAAGQPYYPQDQGAQRPEWQQAAQPPYLNQPNYGQPYDNRQFDPQSYQPQTGSGPVQQNYYPNPNQQYPVPGSR